MFPKNKVEQRREIEKVGWIFFVVENNIGRYL